MLQVLKQAVTGNKFNMKLESNKESYTERAL